MTILEEIMGVKFSKYSRAISAAFDGQSPEDAQRKFDAAYGKLLSAINNTPAGQKWGERSLRSIYLTTVKGNRIELDVWQSDYEKVADTLSNIATPSSHRVWREFEQAMLARPVFPRPKSRLAEKSYS